MYRLNILVLLGVAMTALSAFAVDQNVIEKSLHHSRPYQTEDNRFSLVGVIAEGETGGKGIAVIRDIQKDKTYTLKIGEVVPGHPDLTLAKVSRQIVVLHSAMTDTYVGTSVTASKSPTTKDTDSDFNRDSDQNSMAYESDDDDDDQEVTGLFEKWYQNRGPAVLSPNNEAAAGRSRTQVGAAFDKDLPTPIRSNSTDNMRGRDSDSYDDEGSADDDQVPTRTEYSDAMRALIDSYLNGDSSAKTH